MKKILVTFLVAIFFVCHTLAAQESQQSSQEKTQEQKTKKDIKKLPTKRGFEVGTNWISARPNIDPLLPARAEPFFSAGFNALSDSLQLSTNFQWGTKKISGTSYDLTANGSVLKFKNIGIGPSAYLALAREHNLFIEDKEFTADDFTEKNYGLVGLNVRYGHVNKPNIRASYMMGVAYVGEHGLFKFSNSKQTIKKLYNVDVLPVDMFTIGGSLPNLGRVEINGLFRSVQTRNMFDHPNTKKFVPPRQKILDGSANIRLWPHLYFSFSGTLTDSKYSPAFLGNSCGVKLGLRF